MAEQESSKIEAALLKKGFSKREGAKHTILTFTHQGLTTPIYTKLSRGSGYKKVGDSLLSLMSKQTRLNKMQFLALIDCTISGQDYLDILHSSGFIK
jgi:hypothetical protein